MLKMNRKGFTLVELLVVLAILGLLAGIGIPMYMRTLENSKEATDMANAGALTNAVQAFEAETGEELTAMALGASKAAAIVTVSKNSILNGQPTTLANFWSDPLPEIKSAEGKKGNYWYWNGTIVVIAKEDGTGKVLPR